MKRIKVGGNFIDIFKDSLYYVKGMISYVYWWIDLDKFVVIIIVGGGGGIWGYYYLEFRFLINRERVRL